MVFEAIRTFGVVFFARGFVPLVCIERWKEGIAVETFSPSSESEIAGINSKDQLAALERAHQLTIANRLMVNGVTLADPARIDVRGRHRSRRSYRSGETPMSH